MLNKRQVSSAGSIGKRLAVCFFKPEATELERNAVTFSWKCLLAGYMGSFAQTPRTLRMIKMIITIKRREGMTHEEFVRYQREIHRPLLMSIPEAGQYIKRFVVSYPIAAPDYSGPDYDSVVEGWFESMEDMNALYFSKNFLEKVAPDHKNFMDLSGYGRIVCEEDVVTG